MREKAKAILLDLKEVDAPFRESFNVYVKALTSTLEIPEDIAVRLVIDDLVNKYEKKLILHELFSSETLEDAGLNK